MLGNIDLEGWQSTLLDQLDYLELETVNAALQQHKLEKYYADKKKEYELGRSMVVQQQQALASVGLNGGVPLPASSEMMDEKMDIFEYSLYHCSNEKKYIFAVIERLGTVERLDDKTLGAWTPTNSVKKPKKLHIEALKQRLVHFVTPEEKLRAYQMVCVLGVPDVPKIHFEDVSKSYNADTGLSKGSSKIIMYHLARITAEAIPQENIDRFYTSLRHNSDISPFK